MNKNEYGENNNEDKDGKYHPHILAEVLTSS